MSFLITDAFAESASTTSGQSVSQGFMSILPMMLLLVLFMYLMVIRPQTKKSKEHKSLISNLQKGDEIVTIAGVLGRIEKITDDFIVLSISENTNITIQKGAVSSIVPRGTVKSVK